MASPINQEGPLPLGFTEYKDSAQEDYNFRDGKVDFIRIFDGPWELRTQFIFGHILPSVTEAEGELFFNAPNYYPAYPAARPYRAAVKGLLTTDKDEENFIKHTLARITVYYGLPEIIDDGGSGNNNGGDPDDLDRIYVEENVETETEIIPLPAYRFGYVYLPDGSVMDYDTTLSNPESQTIKATADGKINHLVKRINYKLKLPYVIFPRWNYITALSGTLNSVFFLTPSGLLAAPGQLRYDGITSVTKRELSLGALAWEMEHSFCHYRPGWNTHPVSVPNPNEATQGIQPTIITHAAINPPLFQDTALQLIFLNISNQTFNQIHEVYENLTLQQKASFYTDGLFVSTEVYNNLKQIMPVLNIWR